MKFFNQLSPNTQGYIFTIITMLIWGSFSLLSRVSAQWNIQIWDLLALRFTVASLILLPILYYKKDYHYLLSYRSMLIALVGSVGYCVFVYLGFYYAPVVHGVILLNGLFPILAGIMAWIFIKQPFDRHTKISMIIIISTFILMSFLVVRTNYHFSIGDVFFVGSAICWAGFSVLLKKWKFTAWQVMVSLAIWSMILYLPFYFLLVTPKLNNVQFHHLAIQTIFHSIIVVIVATLSYAKAVEKIGIFKAGTIANIAPFTAPILAVFLLNEPLNMVMVCGLIGMAIGALQPWRWMKKHHK